MTVKRILELEVCLKPFPFFHNPSPSPIPLCQVNKPGLAKMRNLKEQKLKNTYSKNKAPWWQKLPINKKSKYYHTLFGWLSPNFRAAPPTEWRRALACPPPACPPTLRLSTPTGEGAGQDRTGQDRTGQDRTGQDRTGQDMWGAQDRTLGVGNQAGTLWEQKQIKMGISNIIHIWLRGI